MAIAPIKAEATQLIVNSVSNLRKRYGHIGEFHSTLSSMRGMVELTQKVILVAFVLIPLAVMAYIVKSLINRVRLASSRDTFQVLPGQETPSGPRSSPLITEAQRLEGEFEWLLNNLKELRRERAQRFESDMARFLNDGKRNEKEANFRPLFSSIRQNHETLQRLKAMGRGLFVIPARIQDDGIIREPGDGNCLFHSLRDGMTLLKIEIDPTNPNAIELEHALRVKIVEWMKQHAPNDQTLQVLIDQAIGDFIEMKGGQMKIERATAEACLSEPENAEKGNRDLAEIVKVEEELEKFRRSLQDSNPEDRNRLYLNKVGQPGFFGSKAEIYAFSQIYPEVRVNVLHRLNDRFLKGYDFSYNEHQPITINLVYVNGDHFDLQAFQDGAK